MIDNVLPALTVVAIVPITNEQALSKLSLKIISGLTVVPSILMVKLENRKLVLKPIPIKSRFCVPASVNEYEIVYPVPVLIFCQSQSYCGVH